MVPNKLNLGCSIFKKEGFINLDVDHSSNPDIVHNLDEFPYPFEDNQFSEIVGDHVLEHLNHPFNAMKELHRILKPGGKLTIRVPHFSRGFTHPDHKRGFDVSFPFYFDPIYKAFFSGAHFELDTMRFHWFAQPYMKKMTLSPFYYYSGKILGIIFNSVANFSPYFCSRIWCFWVGGFEEIEYKFRKPLSV